jgi:glycerol-3-phosphate O-acyltransferase
MDLRKKLEQYSIPEKHKLQLLHFYEEYRAAVQESDKEASDKIFSTLLEKIVEQEINPFSFEPYHKQVLAPFNYYQFGLDFFYPLVDMENSSLTGHENLEEITQKLALKENVIFLANHQIEADPQAISLLLEDRYKDLAKTMIFVAGERVVTDPMAIPFSMGRNLLCIYSKRYIDHPPELKMQKQLHNKKTMSLMSDLLSEGGHAIYVAPSGGRDRLSKEGFPAVAPFDPQSIEMFYLMAQKAKRPTSFYPMALATYTLLPPPAEIQIELGEARNTCRDSIHLWIGPKISMDIFPGSTENDKKKRRECRASFIWNLVNKAYLQFFNRK